MQIYHVEDENTKDPFYFENIKTFGSQSEELDRLICSQAMEDIEVCDGVVSDAKMDTYFDISDNLDPYDMVEIAEELKIYHNDCVEDAVAYQMTKDMGWN